MENLIGNTRKRSCQTAYTTRTDAIPSVKATGMGKRTPRKALRPMEHDIQDAQDDIGWDKFMFGNISILWQEIQAQYF
jgi:hypothetical protein